MILEICAVVGVLAILGSLGKSKEEHAEVRVVEIREHRARLAKRLEAVKKEEAAIPQEIHEEIKKMLAKDNYLPFNHASVGTKSHAKK